MSDAVLAAVAAFAKVAVVGTVSVVETPKVRCSTSLFVWSALCAAKPRQVTELKHGKE